MCSLKQTLPTQTSLFPSLRRLQQHGLPMACWRLTPVICSAARLKEVIRHGQSTVNTPSLIESRMIAGRSKGGPLGGLDIPFSLPGDPKEPYPSTIGHIVTPQIDM